MFRNGRKMTAKRKNTSYVTERKPAKKWKARLC